MSLPGIFVVGTDTGVGKTRIASAIVRALKEEGRRVAVLKPVATGAYRHDDRWRCEDGEALIAAAGAGIPLERVTPILFEHAVAPPVAARLSGTALTADRVETAVRVALEWWAERADAVVVEGVGGLLCPLTETTTVADLAVTLDLPLVIVARRALGTLNHTLLTIEAARRRDLRIAGLVLNSPDPETGSLAESTVAGEMVRRVPGVALLAECAHDPDTRDGRSDAIRGVVWSDRLKCSRLVAQG